MTKIEAQDAMETRSQVEAGTGDDHDIGHILSVDGDVATVAWESGVRTPCPIADLSAI